MNTNTIELMNGTQIPCFPKETVEETVDNTINLDRTGEYFQVGRRKSAAEPSEPNDASEAEEKLFVDNAFLFLARRDRIMADSRMFLAPVPIQNGLAYTGTSGFMHPTLGVYLEFWLNCMASTLIDDNGRKGLVVHIAGSPLSGSNKCQVVFDDGNKEKLTLSDFRSVWTDFMDINKRYDDAKLACASFSLQQVVDMLAQDGPGTADENADENAVDAVIYKKAFCRWKDRGMKAEEAYQQARLQLRMVKMEAVRGQLTELIAEVDRRQEEIDELSKQTSEERRSMLDKMHANEITQKQFQQWWSAFPVRKEAEEAKEGLKAYVHEAFESIFPNDHQQYSLDEVRRFVKGA